MGAGRGDVEEMERECSLPVSFAGMWRENRTANRPADMLSDMETQRPSQFARLSCWCHSRGGWVEKVVIYRMECLAHSK